MLGLVISLLAPPLCVACEAAAGPAAPLCRDCRARMRLLGEQPSPDVGPERVWAAFPYDGPAGAVVRALKFGYRASAAELIAAQLAANAPPGLLDGVLVPVPAHPRRRRRRGIDHAALIAAALAKRSGLAVSDCLVRDSSGATQVGRARSERLSAVSGSIALRPGSAVPARAIVVDDVVTTGATLRACAAVLVAGGVQSVFALTYARTLGR